MKELKYYGIHAALAIFKLRPQDIIKVYLHESNVKTFSSLLKWCAKNKKAYHIISNVELEKVSGSVHHEGVCLLAKALLPLSTDAFLKSASQEPQCILYLDGVSNSHNVGAIMRTAAHFGIRYIIGPEGELPPLSPSACRIAKGGAEIVRLVALKDPLQAIKRLKSSGYKVVVTSSHESSSLFTFNFPEKSLIVMGAEDEGVSREIAAKADVHLTIPGTGIVESLNVSVAASLFLGHYCQQHTNYQ